jgi:hypothetical protein
MGRPLMQVLGPARKSGRRAVVSPGIGRSAHGHGSWRQSCPPGSGLPEPAPRSRYGTPSRARAASPRYRRSPPWRRTRSEDPAAHRDRRRCRAPRLPPPAAWPPPWRRRRAVRAVISGSVNFRHTEVLERVAGSALARFSIQSLRSHEVEEHAGIGVGAGDQALEAADGSAPRSSASEDSPPRQHGRRVDRLADEDALDQLAALGQAEDLRQGQGGCSFRAAPPRGGSGSACHAPPRRPSPSARRR